ncbi:hypothetical protein KLP28_05175 [Nocardioidaceae bacterium]|nr:hypothetical protein KLP28_05175 [Nocardioidaceae bacterium]
MSSLTSPRGRLPSRVYWVRRGVAFVVVALVSALVVLGLTALLGTDSGGPVAARQVAGEPTGGPQGPGAAPTATPAPSPGATSSATTAPQTRKERREARRAARREAAQAEAAAALPPTPQGACEPRAVRISSRVQDAFAATDIEVPLDVVTLGAEPCSWTFSASTVALDITSGDDRVWTSVQCPGQLPEEELVLVPGRTSQVTFTWNSRRSDVDCSRAADFAYPGWYHVLVAAEGGEPWDQQFELTLAPATVETKTLQPKPRRDAEESSQAEAQTQGDPEGRTESSGRAGD